MRNSRGRLAYSLAAVVTLGSGFWIAEPARAATPPPEPVAIGQAVQGDLNVLATDADAAGTQVRVRTFQSGLPAAVKAQRWSFEVVTGGTSPVYRIKHLSSGRCLEKSTASGDVVGASVIIADCNSTNEQRWTIGGNQVFPTGGFELKSMRDGRCIDILTRTNGEPLSMWGCGLYSTQMWRTRIGPAECPSRTVIGLCVDLPSPVSGVMASWRQQPATLNAQATEPQHNRLDNMVAWNPIDSSGGDPCCDSVEMGWRAQFDPDLGRTDYTAYWLEQGGIVQEYHAIIAPDSQLANGQMHTWMSLGTSNGQWDILYDFNPVGTTHLITGSRTREVEYGLLPQYDETTALATPFENRVQVMDANSLWRRPRLSEIGGFAANVCGQPDPLALAFGNPNTPPWCFTTSLVPRAVANSVPEVDRFVVGKPAVGTLAAPATTVQPQPSAMPAFHNGVDQRALAACMATDAAQCIDTVPGLADCVHARKVCNVTSTSAATISGEGRPVTSDKALELAHGTLGGRTTTDTALAPAQVTTMTINDLSSRTGTSVPVAGTELVHVVTGTDTVPGLGSRPGTFDGYTLVYQASTGRLLYACLGDDCSRKELA
ncbi:RICIN domain-containing protein [Polymorphospora lycopeni]|uniref:RICIN domain-containing protein n=1 Tax=Polymorphospora lycopeni TaxID=3140240 RepID=A0ABV5CNG5_9ACTN